MYHKWGTVAYEPRVPCVRASWYPTTGQNSVSRTPYYLERIYSIIQGQVGEVATVPAIRADARQRPDGVSGRGRFQRSLGVAPPRIRGNTDTAGESSTLRRLAARTGGRTAAGPGGAFGRHRAVDLRRRDGAPAEPPEAAHQGRRRVRRTAPPGEPLRVLARYRSRTARRNRENEAYGRFSVIHRALWTVWTDTEFDWNPPRDEDAASDPENRELYVVEDLDAMLTNEERQRGLLDELETVTAGRSLGAGLDPSRPGFSALHRRRCGRPRVDAPQDPMVLRGKVLRLNSTC